jgi:hypothetical protein
LSNLQHHTDPSQHEVERDLSDCLLPSVELLHRRVLDHTSERDGEGEERDVDEVGELGDLVFGRKGKGLLKEYHDKIARGKGGVGEEKLVVGGLIRLPSFQGGERDDGEVVLGAARVGSDLDVGSEVGVWEGGFVDDRELGVAREGGDDETLGFVVSDGGGIEGSADLGVSELVVLSTDEDVALARAEGVMVESGGDLAVGKGEGFGRGDGVESQLTEERCVLEEGGLMVRRKGLEELGVAKLDDLSATSALGFQTDGDVEGETEKGSKETRSGFDGSCSGVRSDFGEGEDTEISESSGEGDDVFVGGEGAGGGADEEEGVSKEVVGFVPAAREIVGLERALQMAEVGLDALSQEKETGLVGEGGEGVEDGLLLSDLLEESESEIL